MTNSTASFQANLSTGVLALNFTGSTINGPRTITNAAGRTLTVSAGTINADLTNEGLLIFGGSGTFNGTFTAAAGSTLRVQGNATYGGAALTVTTGFIGLGPRKPRHRKPPDWGGW